MSFEFEGEEVSGSTVQLPAGTLDADEAFPRGTVLTLGMTVRVKSVRHDEVGKDGKVIRRHVLVLEDCKITDRLTPAQRRALLDAAGSEVAEANSGDYLVSEEATLDDLHQSADRQPAAMPSVPTGDSPRKIDEVAAPPSQPAAPKPDPEDDDDAAHAWMDEEPDSAVHTVFADRDGQLVDF